MMRAFCKIQRFLCFTLSAILTASTAYAAEQIITRTSTSGPTSVHLSTSTPAQITAFGLPCQRVSMTGGDDIFIPIKTEPEWQAFQDHHPSNTTLEPCAVFSCTGSLPADSIPCNMQSPTSDTPYALVASCSSPSVACEATCKSAYSIVSGACSCDAATFTGWEGSGTSADPYLITNVCELQAITNSPSSIFDLANDINAASTSTWNSGAGFKPLTPGAANKFSGTLQGRGFIIRDLFINNSSGSTGLFGFTGNARISNLGLVNADIRGNYNTGALVGRTSSTTQITRCFVQGTVSGYGITGGLVGMNEGGLIRDTYSACNVNGPSGGTLSGAFGGIVGINGGQIQKSFFKGAVSADRHPSSTVPGSMGVGGICGGNGGTVSDSFNVGTVSSNNWPNPLVGKVDAGASMTNSWWYVSPADSGWPLATKASSANNFFGTGSGTGGAVYNSWGFSVGEPWESVTGNYPKLRNIGGQ